MKKITNTKTVLLGLLFSLLFITSCTESEIESDTENTDNITNEIDQDSVPFSFGRDDTAIFEEALKKVNLTDYFENTSRANYFIPSDQAWTNCFSLLGDNFNSLDDFDTEEELKLLKIILLEHLTNDVGPDGFSSLTELNDISARLVMRDRLKNGPFGIKDATGFIAQFEETNIAISDKSVLHIIDRVLIPESVALYFIGNYKSSLLSFIMNIDSLESLQTSLLAFQTKDYPSFLKDGTPFTFLHPSPNALLSLQEAYNNFDRNKDREIIANIIGYHFIYNQKITTSNIAFGEDYITLQGEVLNFIQDGTTIKVINSKKNQAATMLPLNYNFAGGTIYLVDQVLIPNELEYYKK